MRLKAIYKIILPFQKTLCHYQMSCSLVIHTVAGEATSRSMGSKMRLVVGASWIISPLIRHSFLLSSSTVFMFSIQMASTGPSKISHLRSGVCKKKVYHVNHCL